MKSKYGSSYNEKNPKIIGFSSLYLCACLSGLSRNQTWCTLCPSPAKANSEGPNTKTLPITGLPAAIAFRDSSSNSSNIFWYLFCILDLVGWFVQRRTFASWSTGILPYISSLKVTLGFQSIICTTMMKYTQEVVSTVYGAYLSNLKHRR